MKKKRHLRDEEPINLDGKWKPLCVWAEQFGIPLVSVRNRISRGRSPEDAIRAPYRPRAKRSGPATAIQVKR